RSCAESAKLSRSLNAALSKKRGDVVEAVRVHTAEETGNCMRTVEEAKNAVVDQPPSLAVAAETTLDPGNKSGFSGNCEARWLIDYSVLRLLDGSHTVSSLLCCMHANCLDYVATFLAQSRIEAS